MLRIKNIARNLKPLEDGIWITRNIKSVSYPGEGGALCFCIEEEGFWFQHRNRVILEALRRYPPGGTLFDIGGGNGFVSLCLKKNGYESILVEPGLEGARNARQRGLRPVICSTLDDAGFETRSLPAVGLFDVLEHIGDDIKFLITLRSLLSSTGRLYLTVPAYNFLWSSEDEYAQHQRRYSLKGLTKTVDSAGFEIDYATYFFSILPLPIFLLRTIPSKLGWRGRDKREQFEREHNPSLGPFRPLLRWFMSKEIAKIQANMRIRYGSSCLVVARPKA